MWFDDLSLPIAPPLLLVFADVGWGSFNSFDQLNGCGLAAGAMILQCCHVTAERLCPELVAALINTAILS